MTPGSASHPLEEAATQALAVAQEKASAGYEAVKVQMQPGTAEQPTVMDHMRGGLLLLDCNTRDIQGPSHDAILWNCQPMLSHCLLQIKGTT